MNPSDVFGAFSAIRTECQNTYTAEHIGRLWKNINIGGFCPDIPAKDGMLADIILNKQYG